MRFDNASLYLLRDPFGDESIVDIVRAAVVFDPSGKVGTLVRSIDMPELAADFLSREDDISKYFLRHRADVIFLPTELLRNESFAERIEQLANTRGGLLALVTVGDEPEDYTLDLLRRFGRRMHVDSIGDVFSAGRAVRRFIIREVLDRSTLTRKLKTCAALSLRAMHAEGGEGLEYLIDEVTDVLLNSFVFFGSAAVLHKRAAQLHGVSFPAVEAAVRPVVENAMKSMTDNEYEFCFGEYLMHGFSPGAAEFVFSAAKLTSFSCSRMIGFLREQPRYESDRNENTDEE